MKMKVVEAFEYVIQEFNAIDWSETDGSDIKEILNMYFENISRDKAVIEMLFEHYALFSNYERELVLEMLDECCKSQY